METIRDLKYEIKYPAENMDLPSGNPWTQQIKNNIKSEAYLKIDVLKSVLKLIDEDLALLNKRRYSNNLKESFEFGKGVLIKLKQQIEGDSANVQDTSKTGGKDGM